MARNTTADVTIRLLGDTAGFRRELTRAQWQAMGVAKKMGTIGKAMQNVGRSMSLYVTAPIVGGLALATKAAIDEQKEMALLDRALRNNVKATDEQVAAVERWITATQNATGVSDGDLRPALAAIVTATKDTAKAQDLLSVALDISAAKGKPVGQVAMALAKAYNGNVGALGRLGLSVKDAKGKTVDFATAMERAKAAFGGSAATAAQSTAGKMDILKAKLADLAENIGGVLIPVVDKIAGIIGPLADKFNNLSDGWKNAIVVVGLLVAAIGPLLTVLGTVLTLVPAIGTALTVMTGPIGVVIAAIGLLVWAFTTLYTKNETFRNIVNAVWRAIGIIVGAVVRVIVAVLRSWWSQMQVVIDIGRRVGGVVADAFRAVGRAISTAFSWLVKIADRLSGGLATKAIDAVAGAARTLAGWLGRAWDWLQRLVGTHTVRINYVGAMWTGHDVTPNWSGHNPPPPPKAAGGPVSRGVAYLVGERGPELFTSDRSGYIVPNHQLAGAMTVNELAGAMTVNVNVVVPGGTTIIGTARQVGDILAPHVARAVERANARAARRR